MVTTSASETRTTKVTRRDRATESPRMSASRVDAGIPSSELRRSARHDLIEARRPRGNAHRSARHATGIGRPDPPLDGG